MHCLQGPGTISIFGQIQNLNFIKFRKLCILVKLSRTKTKFLQQYKSYTQVKACTDLLLNTSLQKYYTFSYPVLVGFGVCGPVGQWNDITSSKLGRTINTNLQVRASRAALLNKVARKSGTVPNTDTSFAFPKKVVRSLFFSAFKIAQILVCLLSACVLALASPTNSSPRDISISTSCIGAQAPLPD